MGVEAKAGAHGKVSVLRVVNVNVGRITIETRSFRGELGWGWVGRRCCWC